MRALQFTYLTKLRQLRLKCLLLVTVLAFTGCFGATAMHTDIQEYNKQIIFSEQEMLLYNIGRLQYHLPPHFMMLASIAQTREFSTSAAFQWSQIFTAIIECCII